MVSVHPLTFTHWDSADFEKVTEHKFVLFSCPTNIVLKLFNKSQDIEGNQDLSMFA